jgi:glycosyltransferase involved in cell wall biosynthesis
MKVLFLTSGEATPSTRFRVLPFARKLREAGITCTVAEGFPTKYEYFPRLGFRPSQYLKRATRLWQLLKASVRRYDVVYLERELFDDPTHRMDFWFKKVGRRFVLDLDDAVFLRYPEKIEALTRAADLVIAGNPWIARVLSEWNDRIEVIPTGVELAAFPEKDYAQADSTVPIVGWMGTQGNLRYFEVVAEALRELSRRHDFELRLIAPNLDALQPIDLSGVRIHHVPWRGDTEVEELRKIDVGIMPLFASEEWDKYKCPTKLIQYMAIGVPGVASPVGFTGDVVTHGVDGFIARNTDEWVGTLSRLLTDAELRRTVGRAARQTVAEKYCVEANLPVMLKAFERVLQDEPRC